MKIRFCISFYLLSSLLLAQAACGCPLVAGLTDFNCDGQIKIAVLGDSLVSGVGDTANGGKGGYVLRAAQKLGGVNFVNLGDPGISTVGMLLSLKKAFSGSGKANVRQGLLNTDVVILDLGRNDFWSFGPAKKTLRNLRRISQTVRNKIETLSGVAPLVVTAVLMYPNRGSQAPWIKELDKLILASSTQLNPANLRFDKISKRLLSEDQLHPTPAGYSSMAKALVRYINGPLAVNLAALRPDTDSDGIANFFETTRYGTDPNLYDTDGDGLSDGQEIG